MVLNALARLDMIVGETKQKILFYSLETNVSYITYMKEQFCYICTSCVMVRVLALSVVNCGFEPSFDQIKD